MGSCRRHVFLGVVLATVLVVCAVNPGIRVKISQSGIDYAASRILSEMGVEVKGIAIPPMSGTTDFQLGKVDYSFYNMEVTDFTSPDPSASVSPNDLLWKIDGAYIKIHGDWYYKIYFLIPFEDNGDFDIDLIGISTQTDMVLETDGQGHMAMRVTNCRASIQKIDIKLNGSPYSWLYNLFDDLLSDKVRDVMEDGVCTAITQVINVQVTGELATLQVRKPLVDDFVIDYSLLSAPIIGDSFIQADLKGEVSWDDEHTSAPVVAPPVPTEDHPNKMVNMWLTSYVSNTLGYVMQQHHFINYTLSKDDLPDNKKYTLNTTCPGKMCIGSVLTRIGEMFPGCAMEIPVSTLKAPYGSAIPGKLDAVFSFNLPYYVVFPNKTRLEAFSTKTDVTFRINPNINSDGKITAVVLSSESNVTVTHSNIGTITDSQVSWAFDTICNNIIIPILNNKVLSQGIDLPTLGSVIFVKTELTVQKNALLVSSDIMYNKMSEKKFAPPPSGPLQYQKKPLLPSLENVITGKKFSKL